MEHDRISIHFTSNLEEIPGILNTCMEHVVQKTRASPPSADTFSKIKWVITELLTNAVKHSGTGHCTLLIKVDPDRLTLEKEDQGKPLSLSEQDTGKVFTWPIPTLSGKLEFQIYHNGIDALIGSTEKAHQVKFYIEELKGTEMPGMDMPGMELPLVLIDASEHFGLLIITKASYEFSYEYEVNTQINRFKSIFLFDKTPD